MRKQFTYVVHLLNKCSIFHTLVLLTGLKILQHSRVILPCACSFLVPPISEIVVNTILDRLSTSTPLCRR